MCYDRNGYNIQTNDIKIRREKPEVGVDFLLFSALCFGFLYTNIFKSNFGFVLLGFMEYQSLFVISCQTLFLHIY